MATLDTEELHAALFGTWTAMARVAELLIRRGALSEEGLGALLTAAEMTATDRQSRVGMAIVRDVMESAVRHDSRTRDAQPSGEVIDPRVEKPATARAGVGAALQPEQLADCQGMRPGDAYAMVKGCDFDDATLPKRRTEIVAESTGQRGISDVPRSGPAARRAAPVRIADRSVEPEEASLMEAAV